MSKQVSITITANSKGVKDAVRQANAELGRLAGAAKQADANLSAMDFFKSGAKIAAVVAALKGVGDVIAGSTKEFGKFEQNVGGAEAVFGQFADIVKSKAMDSAKVMGTSINEYLQTANKMGSLFQGAGHSVQNALTMTTEAMQRASDVAAVMGLSQQEAMRSIAGMAKGNFTMMDNLGVAMNDVNLNNYAMQKGLGKTTETMSTAEKVGLAYQLFMERTAKYAGHFASEANTMEGALAIMRATLANASIELGQAFAPMVVMAANFITGTLLPALQTVIPYIVAFMRVLAQAVSFVGAAIGKAFGLGGAKTEAMAGHTKQIAGGMKAAAGAAGGVGKGLDKASGAAKKLAKQLAAFDEMNVAKEPVEPAGGGGAGGGGGGDIPAIELPSFDLKPMKSMASEVDAIAERIKKTLTDMFDFKIIGNAIKRFAADVAAFLQPVGSIVGDVWNRYLKPMLTWAGNSLLPAVLNAIGGALRLVGAVGKAAYDGFIRPFMDYFLVPIAKFAGDVFVGFLNALGDAMRGLSENKGLVEFLVALTVAIAGLAIGIQVATAVQALTVGIKQMHAAAMLSPAVATSVVTSMGSMSAAFVLAGGGLAGMKAAFAALALTVKTAVVGAFTAVMAHPLVLGIAGIAAGIAFVGGSIKSLFEQSAPAMWEAEARAKALGEANQRLKKAVDGVKTAEENLANARLAKADADIAYTEAIKRQEEANAKLAAAQSATGLSFDEIKAKVDSGTLAYSTMSPEMRKVYEAGLAVESANARVDVAQKNTKKSAEELTSQNQKTRDEYDKAIVQAGATEGAQKIIQGAYGNSKDALEELKKKGFEWRDAHGNVHKVAGQDVHKYEKDIKENMDKTVKTYKDSQSGADQGFFGPMGRSLMKAGEWLSGLANTAGEKFNDFKDAATKKGQEAWDGLNNAWSGAKDKFSEIGGNIWSGLKSGLGDIAGKLGGIFSGVVNSVKSKLGIHSPSRVFKSIGNFIDEGLVLGVEGGMTKVDKAMARLTDGFTAPGDFTINPVIGKPMGNLSGATMRLSGAGGGVDATANWTAGLADRMAERKSEGGEPQRIVINIGDEQIIDKIISGVNDRAAMTGQNVIMVQ